MNTAAFSPHLLNDIAGFESVLKAVQHLPAQKGRALFEQHTFSSENIPDLWHYLNHNPHSKPAENEADAMVKKLSRGILPDSQRAGLLNTPRFSNDNQQEGIAGFFSPSLSGRSGTGASIHREAMPKPSIRQPVKKVLLPEIIFLQNRRSVSGAGFMGKSLVGYAKFIPSGQARFLSVLRAGYTSSGFTFLSTFIKTSVLASVAAGLRYISHSSGMRLKEGKSFGRPDS